jgi:hypothetical protein
MKIDERIHDMQVMARKEFPFGNFVTLFVRAFGYKRDSDQVYRVTEVVYEKVEDINAHGLDWDVFSLDLEDAQVLIDSLYECGLRPTQSEGSAGQLEAMQKHLSDMRQLVFGLAKAQIPGIALSADE